MIYDFSVITPSYNQGRFIERTIQSVLLQKNITKEYVIHDGKSTDETLNILQSYKDKLSFISEKDNGQAHAINNGIKSTTGRFIAWINSDDIYYDDTFLIVKKTFDENPDVDLIYGNAYHIDEYDKFIEHYPVENWNPQTLQERCFICQPATFFRRSTIHKYGYLDENLQFCMDYEFWLRLSIKKIKAIRINKVLAGSRMYEDNKTKSQILSVHKEIAIMLKNILMETPDRWLFNYAIILVRKFKLIESNFLFKFIFSITALFVALRFNAKIKRTMFIQIFKWFKKSK